MINNKRYTIVIIILAFLIIMFSTLFLYEPKKADEEIEIVVLTEFNSEIISVKIENEFGNYEINTNPIDVKIYDGKKYSKDSLFDFVEVMKKIVSYKKIYDDNIEKYGFDNPESRVVFQTEKGDAKVFLLGDVEALSSYYYFMEEGKNEVHLIDKKVANCMLMPLSALRDMRMFKNFEDNKFSDLKTIVLKNNIKDTNIAFNQTHWGEGNSIAKYKMVEPVEAEVSWDNVYGMVLEKINALEGDMVFSDNMELEKIGLDNPDYIIELGTSSEKIIIRIKEIDGIGYVVREGSSEIYLINLSKIDFLNRDYLELLKNVVYEKNINTLSKFTIEFSEQNYEFYIQVINGQLKISIDDLQIESTPFMGLYQKACNISVAEELEVGHQVKGKPQLRLIFENRDGSGNDIIEFYEYTDRLNAVSINGNADFATVKSFVLDLKTILEGLNIQKR